ncbi:MAG: hypothetical protein JOZ69_03875 [Myxococcales bacterium]|nr:hypothetical protein [Myxococcales bacterium]
MVQSLGASPPIRPGQLQDLCNALLRTPAFDPDALWRLLNEPIDGR